MKTLSFNDVPRQMLEKDFADFTFSAFHSFFKTHNFEPDTMCVSRRIYESCRRFASAYLDPFTVLGKDARLVFRGLHLIDTGKDTLGEDGVEIELSDIGEDITEALKTRVKAARLYKGELYTMEERLDFPTKVFRFWGIVPMQKERPLNFDEVAVIDGDKVVELTEMESFALSDVTKFYELSQLDRAKICNTK